MTFRALLQNDMSHFLTSPGLWCTHEMTMNDPQNQIKKQFYFCHCSTVMCCFENALVVNQA